MQFMPSNTALQVQHWYHLISGNVSRGFCHIWAEQKGCAEGGSSFLAFLDVSGVAGSKLIAWSYSCAGQNKNFTIVCLWQLLILMKKYDAVDHKFPEPEHISVHWQRFCPHWAARSRTWEYLLHGSVSGYYAWFCAKVTICCKLHVWQILWSAVLATGLGTLECEAEHIWWTDSIPWQCSLD